MRYTVQSVLELLASGMTHQEIIADFAIWEDEHRACCYLLRGTNVKNVKLIGCMKFIIDAQLPIRLSLLLISRGF